MSCLSQGYMKGLTFYESEEGQSTNPQGKQHEQEVKALFQAYISLIHTFRAVSELFLKGEIKSEADLLGPSYSQFSKMFASRVSSELAAVLPQGKESFSAIAKSYDAFGNEVPLFEPTL